MITLVVHDYRYEPRGRDEADAGAFVEAGEGLSIDDLVAQLGSLQR